MRIPALVFLGWFLAAAPVFAGADMNAAPREQLIVSVADQKMRLLRDGQKVADFAISTSRFGEGDQFNSYRTPLGHFVISRKIGGGLPSGAVLKRGRATGEVLAANAAGRDPIVTRILGLRGQDPTNRNAEPRSIYIHGTPEEKRLGQKASFGCIRMRSRDVIQLYSLVRSGTPVIVEQGSLRAISRSLKTSRLVASNRLAAPAGKEEPLGS